MNGDFRQATGFTVGNVAIMGKKWDGTATFGDRSSVNLDGPYRRAFAHTMDDPDLQDDPDMQYRQR